MIKSADFITLDKYTEIPRALLRLPKVSAQAKLTYSTLLYFAWQDDYAHPSRDEISEISGLALRSVARYLVELEEAGLVEHKRGGRKGNIYALDLNAEKLREIQKRRHLETPALEDIKESYILENADPLTRYGFVRLPNRVLASKKVKPFGKILYADLISYAQNSNSCFPAQATLAKDLAVNDKTIRMYSDHLRDIGLINWDQSDPFGVKTYLIDCSTKKLLDL